MPTAIVLVLLAFTVVFVAVIIARPEVTIGRGGKILAFLALFVLPVFAGFTGLENHINRSQETSFCLSCHVMGGYGKSLLVDDASYIPAAHYQNNRVPRAEACYTCHTDYTLYSGAVKAKLRGLHHLYAQYIGKPSQPVHLYSPYNNRECLHCHLGARSFEQGAVHTADPQTMADIKSNKLSCVSSGCHDMVHNVSQLDHQKFWKPVP
ncbi:MAG TPA: NapC/NirT family cytochrome c [Candidatus Angelobacter sp.]|nr:NapC/NirT family cytochrome c [Candidatus Angelobacter sp.]